MLDQSFSFENFKTIFEIENRKGRFEKSFFSKEYLIVSNQITELKHQIETYHFTDDDDPGYLTLITDREKLINEREELLENELLRYSQEVNKPEFVFDLKKFYDIETDKDIYAVGKSQTSFFTMKQLQYNIYRSFKVKQTDRYQIVKQLKKLLQDNMPKYIVRADIKNFYESVPQEKLLHLIAGNQLLSPKSNQLILNLIFNFNRLSGQDKLPQDQRFGVPRGAGVSAYLAELYMRTVDENILKTKDLIFYGRYVDDIIAIYTPHKKELENEHYLKQIGNIVTNQGLRLNSTKTRQYDAFFSSASAKINFLGYRFDITNKKYEGVYLSENKMLKYEKRLKASFNSFLVDYPHHYDNARKLLIHRLNYLTKNTHLQRPKKGLIGIYYSNSLLEKDSPCLDQLNGLLKNMINFYVPFSTFPSLNSRLNKLCFRKGFVEKLFFNIGSRIKNIPDPRSARLKVLKPSFTSFEKIVEAWKQ